MGLRGIFRKNTDDRTPDREDARPAAAPATGAPAAGSPAADAPAGRGEAPSTAGGTAPGGQDGGEPRTLPAEGPLTMLVERLTFRGAERAVLTLVQRGNTMTHQTEQSTGEADPSVETGTVDQDSPLFDPVADLYSESMATPRGPWSSARIEVGPDRDGVRPVVTTFGFPDGSESVQTWQSGRTAPGAPGDAPGADGAAPAPSDEDRAGETTTVPSGEDRADEAGAAPAPGAGPSAPAVPDVDGRDGSSASGSAHDGSGEASGEPAAAGAPERAEDDGQSVPDHVDHEDWHADAEPPAPTGAGAAAAAAVAAGTAPAGEQDASAPETAVSTDVSPSYRAPASPAAGPDSDRLAEGNLVLKESDVLRRLAGAQRRLFGEDGTAMDVSTVLVRVRALGTYYDALTHVRKNGFWDQRRTFDLVPEELLHVQELKDESYVEGAGAPLAMMFRFRPGIPPEVSFDYADEEAFVRYEERLPAQNYLEELRMYPRTGANIPQHMNEALQDWNY